MKYLEEKIKEFGEILPGDVLKVDSFLNHQIDVELVDILADEIYNRFKENKVTKILTIEASGISIACFVARKFGCNVVYGKKNKSSNLGSDVYCAEVYSYTHGNTNNIIVSKKYLNEGDVVLLVDDFLANGSALTGLLKIASQAKAEVVGAGIAIEKSYQPGGAKLRESGLRVESLAKVKLMTDDGHIEFED